MPPLRVVRSPAILLPVDDIDTHQIIPARFLTTTDRLGLGRHCFADWRHCDDGTPRPDFALNAPGAARCHILVGGRNFGCSSSREHAPWALVDVGFQAVVAPSFADIFRNHALKNGLIPVQLGSDEHGRLVGQRTETPETIVTIDVVSQRLSVGDQAWSFPLASFARHTLLEGIDQLGYLLGADDEIVRYEASHPATVSTTA